VQQRGSTSRLGRTRRVRHCSTGTPVRHRAPRARSKARRGAALR
jgi:hypothetical protein